MSAQEVACCLFAVLTGAGIAAPQQEKEGSRVSAGDYAVLMSEAGIVVEYKGEPISIGSYFTVYNPDYKGLLVSSRDAWREGERSRFPLSLSRAARSRRGTRLARPSSTRRFLPSRRGAPSRRTVRGSQSRRLRGPSLSPRSRLWGSTRSMPESSSTASNRASGRSPRSPSPRGARPSRSSS